MLIFEFLYDPICFGVIFVYFRHGAIEAIYVVKLSDFVSMP